MGQSVPLRPIVAKVGKRMKHGVPWNVKGIPPEVRDSARKAARMSGMSVSEWLNSAILDRAAEDGIPVRDFEDDEDEGRTVAPAAEDRLGAIAAEFAKSIERIDRRLDQIANERPASQRDYRESPATVPAPQAYAPPAEPTPPVQPDLVADQWDSSLDQAIAEISSRQHALDAGAAPAPQRPAPPPARPRAPQSYPAGWRDYHPQRAQEPRYQEPRAPQQDLSGLDRQLQHITAQIDSLHRPSAIEQAINALRADLGEIGRSLKEALPKRAIDALEADMRMLAERIDQSRQCGVDPVTIATMERGLAEVRDALRALTPAESLAGFERAVRELALKIDQMGSGSLDIRTLQQLEQAITGLRGVASHVASNDSLTKLAEEVRGLSARIDRVAVNAAGAGADVMSGIEDRISALTDQLKTMSGRPTLPPRIEEILTRFADRAEQAPALSGGDQAAMRNLEDRIADLAAKLDASDARLGSLSAIERGFADLLVHLDEMRSEKRNVPDRDVADLKRDVARTHDTLESVHGALSAIVDRLAQIEAGTKAGVMAAAKAPVMPQNGGMAVAAATLAAPSVAQPVRAPAPVSPAVGPAAGKPQPAPTAPAPQVGKAAPASSHSASTHGAPTGMPAQGKPMPQAGAPRRPIEPTLPPDHPLEPGSGIPRPPVSAAERIAASEAALSPARTPTGMNAGSANFIAAARRAAQAAGPAVAAAQASAATAAPETEKKPESKLGERMKKLLVGASVFAIVVGGAHIAFNSFFSHDDASEAPPAVEEPAKTPVEPKAPTPERNDGRQSGLQAPVAPAPSAPAEVASDDTGSINDQTTASLSAMPPLDPLDERLTLSDKLPFPLRNAAANGDPAAAYEVAMRHLDGRGVPQNLQQAVLWLDRASNAGLAPAQFRLGSLYEKGQGVKKNLEAAQKLYLAAADKGNAKAMHNLAVLQAEGARGKPDYKAAAQWFRKAAERGVADSQYNLGVLYARGIGVEQNLSESFKWFTLAAAQGDKDSTAKRDEVAARLDHQSLITARLAVQNFVAVPQPDDAVNVKSPEGGWDKPTVPASRTPKKPRTIEPARSTAS
jgi:localization factor PodJL